MASNIANPYIQTLNEIQNITSIANIFSNGKELPTDDPQPTFIFLIGSPGVGKTTRIKDFIKENIHKDYNDFYNVSMDSIVERIEPYRILTKKLYNTIRQKRGDTNLSESNFSNLSNVYLPTITSTKSNFGLSKKGNVSLLKIAKRYNQNKSEEDHKSQSENELSTATSKQSIRRSSRIKEKQSQSQSQSESSILTKRKSHKSRKNTKHKKRIIPLKNIVNLLIYGLEYGINMNYNIIYDTTLNGSIDKLKNTVLPLLENHAKETNKKYKIIIMLIKADHDVIYERLMNRHQKMITESGYIRAINPRLIQKFIDENQKGYDLSKKYIMDDQMYNKQRGKYYNHLDFEFIEIENK